MGKDLYDDHRVVQEYFEEASNCLNTNLVKLAFASSDIELGRMENSYPIIFTHSCALFSLLQEQGVVADAFVGFNNGEFASFCVSGSVSFPDGLYIISKYVSLYQQALETLSVQVIRVGNYDRKILQKKIKQLSTTDKSVTIAIYYDDSTHIVVGAEEIILSLHKEIVAQQGIVEFLTDQIGLHSFILDGLAQRVGQYLEKVDFKTVTTPILSGNDGSLLHSGDAIKQRVVDYVCKPLHWDKVVDRLHAYDIIIAVGKSNELHAHVQKMLSKVEIISFATKHDLAHIVDMTTIITSNKEE
jgi:[acyl-carrier-protein] S-malonyltransferase